MINTSCKQSNNINLMTLLIIIMTEELLLCQTGLKIIFPKGSLILKYLGM